MVLALPAVHVVYGRGAFTDGAAVRTAAALAAFAPGLVALGVRDLAMRALYGLQDRWRPAAIACVGLAVNVVGDLVLGPRFGVIGLGAATSLSFAASAVMAVALLARSHDGVLIRDLVTAVVRNAVAVVPTAFVLRLLAAQVPADASTAVLLSVGAAAAVGIVVHLVTLRVLKAPELDALLDLVRELIDRIPGRRRDSQG